ncbi:MAG: ATP-dependent Clp protease ATP-binding subunit ClpA [Thermoplasmata archaeon]|nr:MAG: ATP-dependent Clp protease ATP-binding subunit ClpA [Thermoplasmata archaeon]
MDNNNQEQQIVNNIISKAKNICIQHNNEYITPEHVLASIMLNETLGSYLESFDVSTSKIHNEVISKISKSRFFPKSKNNKPPIKSKMLEALLYQSKHQAIVSETYVDELVIFFIIMSMDETMSNEIVRKHIDKKEYDEIHDSILEIITQREMIGSLLKKALMPMVMGGPPMEQLTTEQALEKYCYNMTTHSAKTPYTDIIGREDEIFLLEQALVRKNKNNAILTGQAGIGKTEMIESLTKYITRGQIPNLQGWTVYSIDIPSIMAGTMYRGDFEKRMKSIVDGLSKKEKCIVFIDEVHLIVGTGAGSNSQMDIGNILKPALARSNMKVIGATTLEEYRETIEKDKALARRFQKIDVKEPSKEETIKILNGLKSNFEKYHSVKFGKNVIQEIVSLADKYMLNKYFPDKAIDIIDVLGAFNKCLQHPKKTLNVIDVQKRVANMVNIPEINLVGSEDAHLSNLKAQLEKEVFGQDEAIKLLSDSLMVARAGLKEDNKTQMSVLFRGPSGTGKTYICEQLAESLSVPLVRFDMSEYREEHSISKLIGSPPGYKGYDEGGSGGGLLINKVEENPNCVLLLDEIEKANSSVLNILLQIMDNGKLASSNGKDISFKNVILIMTSNTGAEEESKNIIGFENDGLNNSKGNEAMNKAFSPEFRNRLDAVIRFNHLEDKHIANVIQHNVKKMNDQLKPKKIKITFDKKLKNWLIKESVKEKMGARPVKRLINKHVKVPLSSDIIFGRIKKGSKCVATINNDVVELTTVEKQ